MKTGLTVLRTGVISSQTGIRGSQCLRKPRYLSTRVSYFLSIRAENRSAVHAKRHFRAALVLTVFRGVESERKEIVYFLLVLLKILWRRLWASKNSCRFQCPELTRFSNFNFLGRQISNYAEEGYICPFELIFSIAVENSTFWHPTLVIETIGLFFIAFKCVFVNFPKLIRSRGAHKEYRVSILLKMHCKGILAVL